MQTRITRRQALARFNAHAGDAPARRLAPREQLVNTVEYEQQAGRVLPAAIASLIADNVDRATGVSAARQAFDRITLRPRMLVPTLDLDLTVNLFGDDVFAPIVVAPIADQKRFHPDGEAATVKGASAAKAPVIVSSHSSIPIGDLVGGASTPIWYQVFAADPGAKQQVRTAVAAGCRAICVTIGVQPSSSRSAATSQAAGRVDWNAVGALVGGRGAAVIVKGVATAADAAAALKQNVHGIVVSNYGRLAHGAGSLILQLPAIVDVVDGRVPVLVDGGFRRGTDIVKALAFGARGVLIGRPVMWGLAAYGADGVQAVLEMLQTELARYMAMCGRTRVALLGRDLLRVHAAAPRAT